MAQDSEELTEHRRLEYQTIVDGYHRITDFRHKLLAFLPLGSTVAVGILATVVRDTDDDSLGRLIDQYVWTIGVFGFLITVGLYFFEWRQVRRCLAYIENGKSLERALGFQGGFFNSRDVRPLGIVGAESAGIIVYGASAAAWSTVAVIGGAETLGYVLLGLTAVAVVARLIDSAGRKDS